MAGAAGSLGGGIAGFAIGGPIGGMIGSAIGGMVGGMIDQSLFGAGRPIQQDVSGINSVEGSPIPQAFGTVRMGGMLVWSTRFAVTVGSAHAGKGSPSGSSTTDTYYGNFAVAICLGPVYAINRIWFDGKLQDQTTFTVRKYLGTTTQTADPLIVAKETAAWAPAFRGIVYLVFEHLDLTHVGNRMPQVTVEVQTTAAGWDTMDNIVTTLCTKADISTANIDATDLAAIHVAGFQYPGMSSVRDALNPLAELYFFDGIESGANIVFKRRGYAAVTTIQREDIVITGEDDLFQLTRTQETDLSFLSSVSFINPENDKYWQESVYERRAVGGGRYSARLRLAHGSRRHSARSVTLNAGYQEMDSRVKMLTDEEWSRREKLKMRLMPGLLWLEVGDALRLDVNGLSRYFRIVKRTQHGVIEIEAESYEPSVYVMQSAPAPASSLYTATVIPAATTPPPDTATTPPVVTWDGGGGGPP